jgi:hypothetical protein
MSVGMSVRVSGVSVLPVRGSAASKLLTRRWLSTGLFLASP